MSKIKKIYTKLMTAKVNDFVLVLILLVTLVVVFSGGIFRDRLERKSELANSVTISPTYPSEDRLWKTYNNEKFGFSFEIPRTFSVVPTDRYGNLYQINLTEDGGAKISLAVMFYISEPEQKFPDAWYKRSLKVDEMEAFQVLEPVFATETQKPRPLSLITRFGSLKDNRFFILSLDGVIKADSKNETLADLISQQETYQRILDSFRCCKIDKHTFHNKQYGYSLIVPSGWNINDGGSGEYISINSPGADVSSISLSIDPKGPYMWNDKIVYPRSSATLQPSEKTKITLFGKNYDLYVYTKKNGHLLQQVELSTPLGENLLISMSDYSQHGLLINHMQNIVKTIMFQ